MMAYRDLIRQWFSRSKSETDIFTKFIFLYVSFIAFLTQAQVRPGRRDRDIIESLKNSEDAKNYYTSLLRNNSELRDTTQRLISELGEHPITNVTGSNHSYWNGRDGVIQDERDWSNFVEFWYRVRNNLFHGHKAPELERDRKLVEYAYLTLSPLMEKFVADSLIWSFN